MDYLFRAWRNGKLDAECWCTKAEADRKRRAYEKDGYVVSVTWLNPDGMLVPVP